MANSKWIAIAYFSAFIFVFFSYLAFIFIDTYINQITDEKFEPSRNIGNTTIGIYDVASVMPSLGTVCIIIVIVVILFLYLTVFSTFRGV